MLLRDAEAVLVRLMAPFVGEHMAGASVRSHAQKFHLEGELTPAQLDTLVTNLGVGLNIFVGREKSARLVAEMRSTLGAQGKGS